LTNIVPTAGSLCEYPFSYGCFPWIWESRQGRD